MKLKVDSYFKGLLLLLLVIGCNYAIAQRTITGTVTDTENGETLIGANVLVKGTTSGTVTDFDGTYSIDVPEGATSLIFSYTGYATQTIALSASNVIDIKMSSGELLQEVVVIGYGTVKREDVTGAIQTVDSKQFNRGAITSAQDLLTGKIAGVNITSSGDPGGGAQIRIRGGSSINAKNDPLIVVDGVPIDFDAIGGSRNPLNIVNPNDIETFTVLKDASATAIYGSRASNGVILITTKKGASGGALSVNYNGNIALSNPIKTVDVLSADEFRTTINEQFEEGHPARELLGDANTDWQSEIYETGVAQDHNINLSGGVQGLPYRLSMGYSDKKGILKTDRFSRTSVALNLSPKFLENTLQFNINAKGSFIKNHFADRGAIGAALTFDPTQPVLDSNSPYGGYFTWTDGDGLPIPVAPTNPLAFLNLKDDKSNVNRFIINGSADYRFSFLPELRANLSLGYDQSVAEGTVGVPEIAAFSFDDKDGGGEDKVYEQTRTNQLLEFYLNYVKEFGPTKLDVMGGYSWQHFEIDENSFQTNIAKTDTIENISDAEELYLLSLFGRLNFSIQDKYLFTFTLRRDGSSRFSPEARWGLFPAAAFAWKAINGNETGLLSDLKVRLGYGITGQQAVEPYYAYLSTYAASEETAQYQFGDQYYTTLRPGPYDLFIKWEETTTYNAGIDFTFKGERVYGSVDVYSRISRDLLNQVPVPTGTNFSNEITTNIGDLENKGLEIALTTVPVVTEDLNWTLGGNVAINENKITKLTLVDDPNYLGIFSGGISGGVGNNIQIRSVGFPVDAFFVYEQIYDASGNPIEGEYVDRNGDEQITPEDRYRLEKPAPNVVLGYNTSVSYKDLTLSAAGHASMGNYVYNNIQSDLANYSRLYNSANYTSNVLSDVSDIQFQNPEYFSDHFVQKGSFFRIDHVTLSYNFDNVLDRIKNINVYATVQNPLLITQYTGIDPELNDGIDNNIYPRSRTILFGVNATF